MSNLGFTVAAALFTLSLLLHSNIRGTTFNKTAHLGSALAAKREKEAALMKSASDRVPANDFTTTRPCHRETRVVLDHAFG